MFIFVRSVSQMDMICLVLKSGFSINSAYSVLSVQQIQRSTLINQDHRIIQIIGFTVYSDGILENGIQKAVSL